MSYNNGRRNPRITREEIAEAAAESLARALSGEETNLDDRRREVDALAPRTGHGPLYPNDQCSTKEQ